MFICMCLYKKPMQTIIGKWRTRFNLSAIPALRAESILHKDMPFYPVLHNRKFPITCAEK